MSLYPALVQTSLNYIARTGERPRNYTFEPPPGVPWRSGTIAPQNVSVANGRILHTPSLDIEGFSLVKYPTAVRDFYDDAEVTSVYYAEIEALLKAQTGAARVLVFDHTRRSNDETRRKATKLREPLRSVHNDYTSISGRRRVFDYLPMDEAEAAASRRHAIVNIWRAVGAPVEESPLAVADARTIAPADLVAADLVYPDRVGETYAIAHNPAHRWFYFPKLQLDEAILIKSYDSAEDGRARFTPHTAFSDPTSPENARPRESIEVRALVFFD